MHLIQELSKIIKESDAYTAIRSLKQMLILFFLSHSQNNLITFNIHFKALS